jgi:hypothetical protein
MMTLLASFTIIAGIVLIAIGARAGTRPRDRRSRHPAPPATPAPKPAAAALMRPMVLVTGGTGTISVPTGESPAVLDSAEVYDCVDGVFGRVAPMTAHRDRHEAVLLNDGRVLIVGGVDTARPCRRSWLPPSFSIPRPETSVLPPR